MGMTKAIQERVFTSANLTCPDTRFVCVRYGNVLASRGSVIPLFHEQIRSGGPVTITTTDMTRFLLSLEEAVDTVFAAMRGGRRGETYIPRVPSAKVVGRRARARSATANIETVVTGIRPGEKVHEILISEEECHRSVERGQFLRDPARAARAARRATSRIAALPGEYSSANEVMSYDEVVALLTRQNLLLRGRRSGERGRRAPAMKVMTVLGTRPEIIRLSRLIPKLDALCDHVLVHTGQNFDPSLSDVFFRELGVRRARYVVRRARRVVRRAGGPDPRWRRARDSRRAPGSAPHSRRHEQWPVGGRG